MATVRAAVVQLTSGADRDRNLATAEQSVRAAAADRSSLVVLPELVSVLGPGEALRDAAEPFDGPTLTWARHLAADTGIWLVAGSFVERRLVDPHGEVVATYRKVHLFDVTVPGAALHESATFRPGDSLTVARVGDVGLGMSICYDLRFPELFRRLVLGGAQVFAVPAAFTAVTGAAHWELLVRARAVENQCFVLAAAQCGSTDDRLAWHGRSLIVDPWGEVLAELDDEPGWAAADLDLDRLAEVRRALPALDHRRPDVYGWPDPPLETSE
jgi:predicted amidohydrolase